MAENETILEGYPDQEKGAYLGAIASLATADREASEEELDYLQQLAAAARLSPEQQQHVRQAATEMTGEELQSCLDVLKNSQLKFSLVADLIAFAKADSDYSEAEEQNIQKISSYLGLNQQQVSLLNQFAEQSVQQPAQTTAAPAQQQQAFLGGGLQEKMQSAGINTGGLLKSVLSIAAPMLIGSMLSRGMGRRSGMGGLGGALGGGLGGMLGGGGLGGMLGGGGGLGSLIGMLSGGGGMRSTGGLLGRILGGRGL
jgi:uncharacterized tellurite resistance protein B-like protein